MNIIMRDSFAESFFDGLAHIPDPPSKLYYLGEAETYKDLKKITIVGSRSPSAYAKQITNKLIQELSGYPVCIISGLALGIDAIAHQSALRAGIPTMAVPGSGLSDPAIYPASNRSLAKQILKQGGLLVSEYPPQTKAARWTFPKRNRIMAALADLVIIIEAGEKSGTLITARLATEYNTTIAVVPNRINEPSARGSNLLIKDGAYPLLSSDDILELLGIEKQKTVVTHQLSDEEKYIYELIKTNKTKDALMGASTLSPSKTLMIISQLELKGIMSEAYGKFHL